MLHAGIRRSLLNPNLGAPSLWLDFLLNTASTISAVTKVGPALTFTRASNAWVTDENGTLVQKSSNEPRFDHDKDGIALGLLFEGYARTNICLQSDDLATTWTNPGGNTTITVNAGAFVTGNTTMDDVLHGDSAETIQQTITVTDNTLVAISAYVSQGTTGSHDFVKIAWLDESDGANGFEAWFNISTGAVGTAQADGTGSYTAGSAKIKDCGGGISRISAVGQIVSGQTDGRFEIINTTADAVDTAEATNSVWWGGLQVEEVGATEPKAATSYIPTTTIAVSRAAETLAATTQTVAGHAWINDAAGVFTAYSDSTPVDVETGIDQTIIGVADESGAGDKPLFQMNYDTTANNLKTRAGGAGGAAEAVMIPSATISAGQQYKYVIAVAQGDAGGSINGGSIGEDNTYDATGWGTSDELHIGAFDVGVAPFTGHIAEIKFWPFQKSDAFLVSVTS